MQRYRFHFGTAALVLALLAVGGYVGNWSWTGFRGNTLWDWLHLLLLPVALAFWPLWLRTRRADDRLWRLAAGIGLVVFVVLLVFGYGFDWAWVGFQGNTLWDWLELLILPFVLPAVLTRLTAEAEAQAQVEAVAEPGGAASGDAGAGSASGLASRRTDTDATAGDSPGA